MKEKGNIKIRGEVCEKPRKFCFSESKELLVFFMKVGRGNGEFDSLPVFVYKEELEIKIEYGMRLEVDGYIRKYINKKPHTGIMAIQILVSEEVDVNEVSAIGRILKRNKAKEIKGKELLFVKILLEVYSEQNNSPEYITVFAVGDAAKSVSKLKEGEKISFNGNLQFRIGKGDGKEYFEVRIYHFDKI